MAGRAVVREAGRAVVRAAGFRLGAARPTFSTAAQAVNTRLEADLAAIRAAGTWKTEKGE